MKKEYRDYFNVVIDNGSLPVLRFEDVPRKVVEDVLKTILKDFGTVGDARD